MVFTVDGLLVEQSYLPGLIGQIRQLIAETGIIVRNPWSDEL
jgi:hypothetical protein